MTVHDPQLDPDGRGAGRRNGTAPGSTAPAGGGPEAAGRSAEAPVIPAVRLGPVSMILRPRVVLVTGIALVLLVLVAALNIGRGTSQIEVFDVLRTLAGGGDRRENGIIFSLRMPRTLTGVLVGAALGLSGALFQSLARNPLASPDILGVTWGAGVGAVAVIVLGGSRGTVSGAVALGVPAAGLVGGLAAGLLLYLLSWRQGIDGYRMVLVGIGLSAIGGNIVYWLLTVGDVDDASRATVWLVGSLANAGWDGVGPLAIAVAILVPATLACSRVLGGLQFGDDTSRALGIRVDGARGTLLLLAAALAAVAAATAGPIAFVALATPQIAMRLVGASQPPLVASMVLGALLTVSADLAVRITPGLSHLPVGVLTAVLGAPYLIYLFVRTRRRQQS
ncbi:iron complex transport system permease protein [Actinoalloteichus hoggarensis]|uniref:Putative siderophore transport system permease protein YfhA n=2 Tax=Actinoalloteichus hoggarensis TaxID=1470176 RepID=A0A221W5P7_9PSEU|nr:putative siderophore transport system permease protein YfhA [Actinoalloteichus hoggarensis]MBB5921194.1 iron complex transport system permease protein [Actinoalloteichus hoggarensis]